MLDRFEAACLSDVTREPFDIRVWDADAYSLSVNDIIQTIDYTPESWLR